MMKEATYFGSTRWYSDVYRSQEPVQFLAEEPFRKQTTRNRMVIDAPQGELRLSIPVVGSSSHHQLMRDTMISDHGNWRHQHWQALCSSYGDSPFFEYYKDDIRPFFIDETILSDSLRPAATPPCRLRYLLDFNIATYELMQRLIPDLAAPYYIYKGQQKPLAERPTPLVGEPTSLAEPLKEYHQVFKQRHGFLQDLSILDLLFNEGPQAILYL